MKTFVQILMTVVVAMLISCGLNSLFMELGMLPKMAPGQMGTSVSEIEVKESPTSPNRKDVAYGDFVVTDSTARPTGFASGVVDDQQDHQIEFPMSW